MNNLKSKKRIALYIIFSILIIDAIQYCIRYDIDNYCCVEMSRDEEKYLEGLGIDTQIVRGNHRFEDGAHLWIRIGGLDIDSVLFYPLLHPLIYENMMVFDSFGDFLEWRYE